jgi:Ser/Thr protein kinase RdoA (MazF antagonist)
MISNKTRLKNILYSNYLTSDQKISSIDISDTHEINSQNFKINLKDGKSFYLKFISEFNKDHIKKIQIMDECYKDGIKVPKIVLNNEGKLVTIQENKLFLLTEYCIGKKFSFNSKEIFSAGENLALLNKKLSKYNSVFKRKSLYDDMNQKEIEKVKDIIYTREINDIKIRNLIDILPELYSDINNNIKPFIKKKQLVHIDFHPQNVLFKEDQLTAILDFDSIATSFELQSIAFACERFSKNTKGFLTLLNGYQKCGRKFSLSEKKILPYFFGKEAISRINYIIRKQFFFEDKTWSFELDKHLNILERMGHLKNELKDINLICE